MTELLTQADAYLRSTAASVLASVPDGVVLDRTPFYPQGGGQPGEGRLDFDMPDGLDTKAVEADLDAMIARDLPVMTRFITDEELLASPGLVRTISVRSPMGTGRVRLVAIGDVDLQPCGGTHVASTAEIGPVRIIGVEKKGKQNRRVRVALAERNVP